MNNSEAITAPTHSRIALVFDFDDTLAPDSTSSFLKWLGMDPNDFWEKRVQPLVKDGWDPLPAQFYAMTEISRKKELGKAITKDLLSEFGSQLELFTGVKEMFTSLKKVPEKSKCKIDLEFYILSCGIEEIICKALEKVEYSKVWSSSFHYSEEGEIDFAKMLVTHTEKSRFLHRISKGLMSDTHPDRLFEANRVVSLQDLHVPLNQMVYVGDGFTDIPCFEMISKENGIPIGVDKPDSKQKWGASGGYSQDARVLNLAKPDYQQDSEMMKTLELAIQSLTSLISIKEMSHGE